MSDHLLETWRVHDMLVDHVQAVTIVHPPHMKLLARAEVMTDKKAALMPAKLLARGLGPAPGSA